MITASIEPAGPADAVDFEPGDYLQFDIPEPYAAVWDRQHVFNLEAGHREEGRRNNYSIAGRDGTSDRLVINVRLATPPPGQDCPPGAGSSYMFHLKPGDTVTAIGPFGEFHIKPTQKEMVYTGGGAGMAPLRAHLTRLLEQDKSERRISYWYGARSRQEIYYADYFERLAAGHDNFHFHLALSEPLDEDDWTGPVGFIHEVVHGQYLESHPNPGAVEFYLCGPPMMIKACNNMLDKLGVDASRIASPTGAIRRGFQIWDAGADAIYACIPPDWVREMAQQGLPVVGYVGLVPQKRTWLGGFKAHGKTAESAMKIYQDTLAFQQAGAIGVEMEVVPERVASEIAKRVDILVISMGAGPQDVQYLFAERERLHRMSVDALRCYHEDVASGELFQPERIVPIEDDEFEKFMAVVDRD